MRRAIVLSLILSSPYLYAVDARPYFEWSTRQWTLRVAAQDPELVASLKGLTLMSWCFESLSGRGLLKDMTLHLAWEKALPRLSFSKEEITAGPDNSGILSCLDASLKEYPPLHRLSADEINFQYSIKRRR